jgi:hypothetical protein
MFRTRSGLIASMPSMLRASTVVIASSLAVALAAGCGSSSTSSSSSRSTPTAPSKGASEAGGAGALSAEAKSAATGDIPDNQVFLTYRSSSPAYTMLYPEGWALKGTGADVTISDKNNIVHVVIASGGAPTAAGVAAELKALKRSSPTLAFTAPTPVPLKSGPAVKATYTTQSTPNPVTGKSVLLIVDRYELDRSGKRATVDLGTAQGVDNVDAYRKMINSFNWQ